MSAQMELSRETRMHNTPQGKNSSAPHGATTTGYHTRSTQHVRHPLGELQPVELALQQEVVQLPGHVRLLDVALVVALVF